MEETNLTNALDERLSATDFLKARLRVQVVPSPRAKARGLELLLSAVRLKKQSRQAQEGLREVA